MEPNTLAEYKAALIARFPRSSSEWELQIESKVSSWTNSLSQEFPYWFLTCPQGDLLSTSTFPLTLSTLPTRGPSGSRWVDSGWLVTVPGQSTYDFYAPLDYEAYMAAPTDASTFALCEVQLVDFMMEFSNNGTFRTTLPVRDIVDALNFDSFRTHQRPVQAMWRKTETKSQIILQPTPDDYYLYSVGFAMVNPPWYLTLGNYYNRWLTFAPEALELYGLMKACEFFNEPTLMQTYQAMLYGSPPKGSGVSSQSNQYLGELGRMKKVTRRQRERMYEKLEFYESKAEAAGGNYGAYPGPQSVLRFRMPQYRKGMW